MTSFPLGGRILWSAPHRVASWVTGRLGGARLPVRSEFARLRPATRGVMIGLAGFIGLVVVTTAVAIAFVEAPMLGLPEWLGARAPESNHSETRSAASFANIVQRPLFSRSRQIIIEAVAVTPPQPAPLAPALLDHAMTLRGVFISGALAKAFLTSAQNPAGTWVQTNDEIAGWRVVAVAPDHVELDGRTEKRVIPLSIGSTAK